MKSSLQRLHATLRDFSETLDFTSLITQLDQDVASLQSTVIALAAPDPASISALKDAVFAACPCCVTGGCPPYRSLGEWSPDDYDRVYQSTALIAGTGARQFLPDILFRLQQRAASEVVPALLLVDGIGRMRDPKAHIAALTGQLNRTLPSNTLRLIFLKSDRFEGESAVSAISNFLDALRAGDEGKMHREDRILRLRQDAARAVALGEAKRIRRLLGESKAAQYDVEETCGTLQATGEAVIACWANSVREFTESIALQRDHRSIAAVVGDTSTELEELLVAWQGAFHVQFESKIAAYVSTVARRLRMPSGISAASLSLPLSLVVRRASHEISTACQECSDIIQGRLRRRDAAAQRAGATQSAIQASSDRLDSAAASMEDALAESDDGLGIGDLVSAVAIPIRQVLNSLARKDIANALGSLIAKLGQIRDQTAAAIEKEIGSWISQVAARALASEILPQAVSELQSRAAVVAECLARLEEK